MEEAVKLLLEQLNPWKQEGPSHESWTVCTFCDCMPERDETNLVWNLGHMEDCKYRVACELLHVEMKSAYDA